MRSDLECGRTAAVAEASNLLEIEADQSGTPHVHPTVARRLECGSHLLRLV
jgi:hypothetical protein